MSNIIDDWIDKGSLLEVCIERDCDHNQPEGCLEEVKRQARAVLREARALALEDEADRWEPPTGLVARTVRDRAVASRLRARAAQEREGESDGVAK